MGVQNRSRGTCPAFPQHRRLSSKSTGFKIPDPTRKAGSWDPNPSTASGIFHPQPSPAGVSTSPLPIKRRQGPAQVPGASAPTAGGCPRLCSCTAAGQAMPRSVCAPLRGGCPGCWPALGTCSQGAQSQKHQAFPQRHHSTHSGPQARRKQPGARMHTHTSTGT